MAGRPLGENGNLGSHPPDDSAYIFTIMNLNRTRSAQELRATLPQLAKSAGLKNFKLGEVEDTESDTMKFAEVKGSGEANGLALVIVVTGFEAQKGRFFALLSVGLESTQKKHAKDFEAIAASIEPLQATSGKAPPRLNCRSRTQLWAGPQRLAMPRSTSSPMGNAPSTSKATRAYPQRRELANDEKLRSDVSTRI